MDDFQSHQIFSKTKLHSTITSLFQSFLSETPPNYKHLLLQITNLNPKFESITLSDSNHSFKFHISQKVLEAFKVETNKFIMTSKFNGSFVMITSWEITHKLIEDSHKFDISLEIKEMQYIDGLNNEYVEGNHSFYKPRSECDFVIDLKNYEKLPPNDPLKKNILKLRKTLIRKAFKSKSETMKDQNLWTQMMLKKNDEMREEVIIIEDQNENEKPNFNEKLNRTNEKNNEINWKKTMKKNVFGLENKVKLIYDEKVLEEIYGKNSQDNSFISDLESLNIDPNEETREKNKENHENSDFEKNSKKRKDSEIVNFMQISSRKIKIDEKTEKNIRNEEEEKKHTMNFTLSQIMKYKNIFLKTKQ